MNPTSLAQIEVYRDANEASRKLAARIATEIRQRSDQNRPYALGLATGASPIPFYNELIRLHREEGLSFANVVTFNLDEYFGLPADDPRSYHAYMSEKLFEHIDLPPSAIHLPGGMVPQDQVAKHCADYEAAIEAAGGIDLQILGIGRSGHIGFNEPPSAISSKTRMVSLDPITRQDAAKTFSGFDKVPTRAITMGVETILRSRQIVLMGWGEKKADIILRSLTETPSPDLPAAYLQLHDQVTYLLDEAAASNLDLTSR